MRLAIKDLLRLKDIRTASEARGPEQLALDPASCSLTFGNCLGPRASLAVLMSFSAWVVSDPAAGNIAEEPKPKAVLRFLKLPLDIRYSDRAFFLSFLTFVFYAKRFSHSVLADSARLLLP